MTKDDGVFTGLSFFVHQHHRPTHSVAADCDIITSHGGSLVTSPLVATYILVEIPFEHINPEKRKFYIHRRQSESTLSNWDRWSRDWVWTLDELMGLAADKTSTPPATLDSRRRHSFYELEDIDDQEEAAVEAVMQEPATHSGMKTYQPTQPATHLKQVVQRYWLGDCIEHNRVLDRDAGWHVDCVEGWQYPHDSSILRKAPTTWGIAAQHEAGVEEEEEGWSWGVREDENGFGFGWRKEPKRRVVSEPMPMSTPKYGPLALPECRPQLTPKEIQEQYDINRRMNESRRFSISHRGELLWNHAPQPSRRVTMPSFMPSSTSSQLQPASGGTIEPAPWSELDSRYRFPHHEEHPDADRSKSPGRMFRVAAWDLHRQPQAPMFHPGLNTSPAPTSLHKSSGKKAKKQKARVIQSTVQPTGAPQIFAGKTFTDFNGAKDSFSQRVKQHGGRFVDITLADVLILRTDPGQTTNQTYLAVINRKSSKKRRPHSKVLSIQWAEGSMDAGRLLQHTPYLVTASSDAPEAGETTQHQPKSTRKHARPQTPDLSPDRSFESISQAPISPDNHALVGSSGREPSLRDTPEVNAHGPRPTVGQQKTPQEADYEDDLIDLDYEDGMMVDLDVHLTLPPSYNWGRIPKIDLPPTVMSTHADGVRVLIAELTKWDGEGTKAECLRKVEQKGLQGAEVLYTTYRSVIDERVPGLAPVQASKRARH